MVPPLVKAVAAVSGAPEEDVNAFFSGAVQSATEATGGTYDTGGFLSAATQTLRKFKVPAGSLQPVWASIDRPLAPDQVRNALPPTMPTV